MDQLRPELTELPERIKRLRVHRGYPVPWFVPDIDGVPEFRVADARKWRKAVNDRLCWVCGEQLGSRLSFVLGPMCSITRTTAEPPCHNECAVWSAINCPFLARPQMIRRDEGKPDGCEVPGEMIERNPGVALIWTTRGYQVFKDGAGKFLITVGNPERIEAFRLGQRATLSDVIESINSGFPLLDEKCDAENTQARRDRARIELNSRLQETIVLLDQHLK